MELGALLWLRPNSPLLVLCLRHSLRAQKPPGRPVQAGDTSQTVPEGVPGLPALGTPATPLSIHEGRLPGEGTLGAQRAPAGPALEEAGRRGTETSGAWSASRGERSLGSRSPRGGAKRQALPIPPHWPPTLSTAVDAAPLCGHLWPGPDCRAEGELVEVGTVAPRTDVAGSWKEGGPGRPGALG